MSMKNLMVVVVASLLQVISASAADSTEFKFSFGSSLVTGFTQVPADAIYSADRGYGFEPGAKITTAVGGDMSFCTSGSPFYFSAAVPEGNYKVTLTLGDPNGTSSTTIKAELRRLMIENIQTEPGKRITRSFIVNVRTPKIAGGGEVHLKSPRETTDEAWAWDDKLTLEFNGSRPCLSTLQIEKVDVPTVFILGDSTVCDQALEPYASWGQMLPRFFKPDVAIANHAESGETLAGSTHARRLEKVLSLMKPGDYLFIQFGHNDMKSKEPDASETYKTTLKSWIEQTRSHGGIPVLITPVNRHSFQGDVVTNSFRDYPDKVRETAKEEGVALIDLNAMSKTLYESFGPKESIHLFKHNADLTQFDATHHSPYGAYELARCVVEGIRQNKLDLVQHLADDVAAFAPAKPDAESTFKVPPTPASTTRRPLGD